MTRRFGCGTPKTGACLNTLEGHSQVVYTCAYSPDGRRIVSGSSDKTLRVWDAETGACLMTSQGHSGPIAACAYSPDGRRIISGSEDKTLRVWDAKAGACLNTLTGHSDRLTGSRMVSRMTVAGSSRVRGTSGS